MNDAINSFSAWYVATQALRLRDSDLETAVQLLGQVLETRNKAYGENALECADTYLYYGQCLFEQAQVGTCCSWSCWCTHGQPLQQQQHCSGLLQHIMKQRQHAHSSALSTQLFLSPSLLSSVALV